LRITGREALVEQRLGAGGVLGRRGRHVLHHDLTGGQASREQVIAHGLSLGSLWL
jgi:hypothetical protein